MDRDSRLYRYIYEFYVTRIQSGYYIKGDAIPSIHEISETFGVSDKTTRRMLRQLKEDGFISSGSGRSSVVIKDFSNEDHADFCRTYYLAHKDAALELQCLRRSFLSSILFPAFCRLPAEERAAVTVPFQSAALGFPGLYRLLLHRAGQPGQSPSCQPLYREHHVRPSLRLIHDD